jgi:hypothetical protein
LQERIILSCTANLCHGLLAVFFRVRWQLGHERLKGLRAKLIF